MTVGSVGYQEVCVAVGSVGYQEVSDFPRGNTDVPSKCHLPIY
jgi:hypothetical protein